MDCDPDSKPGDAEGSFASCFYCGIATNYFKAPPSLEDLACVECAKHYADETYEWRITHQLAFFGEVRLITLGAWTIMDHNGACI